MNYRNIIKWFIPIGLYEFYKTNILPLYRAKKDPRRNKNLPQWWRGKEISPSVGEYNFKDKNNIKCITSHGETRAGIVYKNNNSIYEIDFNENNSFDSIQLGISPMSDTKIVEDVRIQLNAEEVAFIKGPISNRRWTDMVLSPSKKSTQYSINFTFKGDELSVSDPIRIQKSKNTIKKRNIIVLILDSLMPCKMSTYNGKDLTQNIDSFFSEKTYKFWNAFSQGEWTLPSLASIVTGIYAIQHGVYNPLEYQRELPKIIKTFPEKLRTANYHTYCNSAARRFIPPYGHYRGFNRFVLTEWLDDNSTNSIVQGALEFIEAHKRQNFLCFLHFCDPHPPYGKFSYFSDLTSKSSRYSYLGKLYTKWKNDRGNEALLTELIEGGDLITKQLDFYLGQLFNYLKSEDLLKNTSVILTADHGRFFLKSSEISSDNPYKSMPLLNEERVRVPLLIRDDNLAQKNIYTFAENGVDIYPTVMELAGIEKDEHLSGKSLINKEESRTFGISESLFKGTYEIAIRNIEWCYVYRCKMNEVTGDILYDDRLWEGLFPRHFTEKSERVEVYKKNYSRGGKKKYRKKGKKKVAEKEEIECDRSYKPKASEYGKMPNSYKYAYSSFPPLIHSIKWLKDVFS